ncbi:Ig-like domain-containing protein [Methanobrevibacter sp.]|uniref:Ig-like domain-containing protein n=1 Tax=Methanobrevibacter sp. TaxID=66852 RepID=UPI00388D66A2
MKIKYVAIFLVLLCCIMGTASAAEDISTDVVSDSVDDAVVVDAVQEEIDDSSIIDDTGLTVSDDTNIEEIDDGIKADENNEESEIADSEQTRATSVNAKNWDKLWEYATATGTDYDIKLTGTSYTIGQTINFANNANIIGTSSSYITGGSSSQTPFQSTGSLNITFTNVTFRDIDASVLFRLATTGKNQFINCSFDNIHTYAYKSSVIWNDKGYMNISGCNFTNCNDGFGAITNYATTGTVQMNVENCRFENNTGRMEPGAINNCGELNVTNCTFIHNVANWWAGAIHTHTFANTRIIGSNFTDNVAGWNGGALFSYSTLEVFNSTFTGNNCTTNTGGGAICGYSYQGSIYNITVDSCNFTHNTNKNSNGRGGAIGVQNIGYLSVCYSNFINNVATNGTAISAICEDIPYCNNCTNCSCPNCPNCTNCSHNVSTGDPSCKIYNNTFINHTGPGDTVVISGNDYLFENNTFINCIQSIHYNGTGNTYNVASTISNPSYSILKSNLGATLISDGTPNELYVNISREDTVDDDDEQIVSGLDWENAYGGLFAYSDATSDIASEGVIYVASGTYSNFLSNRGKTYTVIGQDNTIFSPLTFSDMTFNNITHTFINIIFEKTLKLETDYGIGNRYFINCTFRQSSILIGETSERNFDHESSNYGYDLTVFEDCIFESISSAIDCHKYENVEFKNCTFKNIEADSLIYTNSLSEGAIKVDGCRFENCTVKGVAKFINDVENLISIEDCTYDFEVTSDVISADGAFYINTTQSRADSNLTVDIDGDNLVITLTDSEGNPITDVDEISVVINEENIPSQMDNGVTTINISDFTGKVNIAASFAGNANYKESTATLNTYIVVKTVTEVINNTIVEYVNKTLEDTSIVASALTATAKVAKTLSVTLKDASGKAIANKVITYSINGVTKTVKTDANGIAKITVNQAKAGAYYYSLCFLGDNDYKASFKTVKVTVNKQATKAVFKAKTFKVKAKTKKVSFTLKDASGKAIKGKKITVKVNGKTYTATTNAKGVATFKVKLNKKGKYTATAKFAGDTSYKAITKKAKITLK